MSHPLPARRRLVLLVAVLAALALAAGFAWRSTPVPVQNTAYAFACPRSVSVQTQGDRSTFWVKGTQVGGIDCYPALPWETLTQGPWTVPRPCGGVSCFWDKLFPHGAQFPPVQSYCQ